MKRKIVSFFLVVLAILVSINTSFLNTSLLADEECDQACKIQNATNQVQKYKEDLKNAKEDVKKYSNLMSEIGEQLQALYDEISVLTPQIEELGLRIEELEESIAVNEGLVEELNNRVLTRMENAQGTMHFNPYLDFLLGSNGFSDMLRRVYGIEAINEKEEKDRNQLMDIIEQLNVDKAELDESKKQLEEKKEELDIKTIELEGLEEVYKEKLEEAEAEVAYYQNLYDNAVQNRRAINITSEELAQLTSASGFLSPVPGASISAGFPYYPASFGGGVHLGVDYAAKIGTNLYAPADGVILVADDGSCDTYGYLGNSCGGARGGVSYGGNQVYMICSVNDKVYGITYSHLYLNSVSVSPGDVVFAGDYIARVGSSGNSTGAHCHIEMFYLGVGDNEDLLDYIRLFNNGSYSLSFNCGWGSAALSRTCDNNGYSAPCRLNGSYYLP